MKNLKDTITTIGSYIMLLGMIGGVVEGALAGANIICPIWLYLFTGICIGIPPVINLWAAGKNPDLSKKTPEQINAQMNPNVPQQPAPPTQ